MTPWVKRLLAANVAMFVLTWYVAPLLMRLLAFVPALVIVRPWTLVTYMFLHAGIWHLAFNMIGLYFFGPRLESRLGSRSFLLFYLVSGIGGALLSIFTPYVAIVGASGAVFGVLLGFARYWPRERIYIWGVLPVEARVLVIVLTVASLYMGISGGGAGIAHFAHLGGFLGGYLYLKGVERFSAAARFKAKVEAVPRRTTSADFERWTAIPREGLHPLNREELERLLEKIDRLGAGSLTTDEKQFLERLAPR